MWRKVRRFDPGMRFLIYLFLKWRSALAHQFHVLGQVRSTVAQRAEATIAECSLTSCVSARFPCRFPHAMPGQNNQPTPTSLGQGCVDVFIGVTWHLRFGQNDRGLLRATPATRGWNGNRIRVTTAKFKSREEEKFPPLFPGLELATFRSRVPTELFRLV